MPTIRYSQVAGNLFDLNSAGNKWFVPLDALGVPAGSVASVQATRQGAWTTAVLTIGRSNDGANVHALESATTLGPPTSEVSLITATLTVGPFAYLAVSLTTLEGSAAYCDIIVTYALGS